MIDMVMDEKNKQYFITDIEHDDKEIKVKRADGSVSTEPFSHHNLGFYRTKMVENAKEYINPYMDDLSKDSFFTFVKRYGAIVVGIVGFFFLYNVDIHLIMKIVLTVLIALGEFAYYLYNCLYLSVINVEAAELLATEYYIKNIEQFRYYDKENGTDGYIVPPEDISKYGLAREVLEQLNATINEFKNEGFEPKDMNLTYKRREPENGKSML